MKHVFQFGNVLGVAGIVICVASVAGRFIGANSIYSVQAINMYMVGTGLVVMGCFAKLSGR